MSLTEKFSKPDTARETFIATTVAVIFILISLILYFTNANGMVKKTIMDNHKPHIDNPGMPG